jgi:hypothetical protein
MGVASVFGEPSAGRDMGEAMHAKIDTATTIFVAIASLSLLDTGNSPRV